MTIEKHIIVLHGTEVEVLVNTDVNHFSGKLAEFEEKSENYYQSAEEFESMFNTTSTHSGLHIANAKKIGLREFRKMLK